LFATPFVGIQLPPPRRPQFATKIETMRPSLLLTTTPFTERTHGYFMG
jgi:hypothetical protein